MGLGINNDDTLLNDLYSTVLSPTAVTWKQVYANLPSIEPSAHIHFATFDQNLLIFGGNSISGPINSLFAYKTLEHNAVLVHASAQPAVTVVKASSVIVANHIYIFGGKNANGEVINRLFDYDTSSKSVQAITNNQNILPEQRYKHCSVAYADRMFVFFGISAKGIYLNDVWSYNILLNEWTQLSFPRDAPTARAGMACAITKTRVYIYGGENEK